MNPITPWIVCIALLAMLIGVVYVSIKTTISKNKEIKTLSTQLKDKTHNAEVLVENAEENAEIKKDEKKTEEKINGAKNDEEVFNIVNSIVDANNNRVHK